MLRHRLHRLDSVVAPAMMYGAGTWTTTQEHEKMIRTTQRKVLWLIIQTRRKYKSKSSRSKDEKDVKNDA